MSIHPKDNTVLSFNLSISVEAMAYANLINSLNSNGTPWGTDSEGEIVSIEIGRGF